MADWVRFHRELNRGTKRGLSRAHRYVYMELSLEARPTRGRLELPPGMKLVDAIHDLIGGNKKEISAALAKLMDPKFDMISVEDGPRGQVLVIRSWERWNDADKSTERVKAHRERKKNKELETNETVSSSFQKQKNETPETPLEERREEKSRGDDVATAAASPQAHSLLAELKRHPPLTRIATMSFASALHGVAFSAGKRDDHVSHAIAQFAVDYAENDLSDLDLRKRLRGYVANARPPSAARSAPEDAAEAPRIVHAEPPPPVWSQKAAVGPVAAEQSASVRRPAAGGER